MDTCQVLMDKKFTGHIMIVYSGVIHREVEKFEEILKSKIFRALC
jgi:hypothetical protein